jgi:hypothetical protein
MPRVMIVGIVQSQLLLLFSSYSHLEDFTTGTSPLCGRVLRACRMLSSQR